MSLYVIRETSNYPISETFASEGGGICYPNKYVLNFQ